MGALPNPNRSLMKKNRNSKSGFFTPRIFLAFIFCSGGLLLAMFSFAAPMPAGVKQPDVKGPFIATSQPPASFDRDLRALPPIGRVGPPLRPRVFPPPRPRRPVIGAPISASFIDTARQPSLLAAPMPAPSASFKGLDFDTWGDGHPPDTVGDVG